jgi:hypothetical protein
LHGVTNAGAKGVWQKLIKLTATTPGFVNEKAHLNIISTLKSLENYREHQWADG